MITQGQVLDIARDALYTIITVSAPLLLISLIVGLVVSIFQNGDIHTGTDTYIYTEDHRGVCWNDLMWFLDVESVVRFHGKAVE